MRIFALSDLHLSFDCDKPMDIFGGKWEGYTDKIKDNWSKIVQEDDTVLIAGDISWAMRLEEVKKDLEWINSLTGKKIMIKGNHEYWWKSISAVRAILPESLTAIQNDAVKIGDFVFCGTRGWTVPDDSQKNFTEEDMKIYRREVERLKLTLSSAKRLAGSEDKIIAMMHYPPFLAGGVQTEFTQLFEGFGVSSVVFGHLHGYTNCPRLTEIGGVKYYFTSCDHTNMTPVLIWEENNN